MQNIETSKLKTHWCAKLSEKDINTRVNLAGWVSNVRDLGGIIFVELRDRSGIIQIVADPIKNTDIHKIFQQLKSEYVINISGILSQRPADTFNPNLTTGAIEIYPDKTVILSESETPPFIIEDDQEVNEDLRLKYRYLDLRRPKVLNNLLLRHKITTNIRNYMNTNEFIEVETPILIKTTPEGARDYLVPSRIHKGKFYALPQSPQTYKQLLMISGFDRYFQIVKCFRDEDLRADRQPEFTQIDVEMSFVDQEDIFQMVEGLMKLLYKEIWNLDLQLPLPMFSFDEAMEKYGSDKPDLRFNLSLTTLNKVFASTTFKVFKEQIDAGGIITGLLANGCGDYTRNQLDVLTDFVKKLGAGGLIWMRVKDGGELEAPIAKFLTDEEKQNLIMSINAKPGDLIFILTGSRIKTLNIMGLLRLEMARRLDLIKADSPPKLLWVTDFPLFEWDEESKRFYAMHHPFTSPRLEDVKLMDSHPEKVKARAYDLVLNGSEIAGGSIRIHNASLQAKMFKALGISHEEAEHKFGFLTKAFKYGAPPHGGIAFGFDRMVMIFVGESSIREVIAFPKTASAISLMDDSPSNVSEEQLRELHIKIR
ncbi:MAG TPA: aspartate--tRNA ligase [Ignavibacteriales bacterium]|nr:aspartate--tRNA ligase [Ignavibacteriales bacterium]